MKLNSKSKGNRGELELVKILEKKFGKGRFKRTPMSGAYTGGANQELSENLSIEAKIVLVSDIITPIDFRYIIEHKFIKEASFWDLFNEGSDLNSWIEQATYDAKFVNKQPMIVIKYNRKKRIVYIKECLGDYIFEYKGWHCYWLEDLLKLPETFFYEYGG